MNEGSRTVLPPAGNQPQDEAVADPGNGAGVGDSKILGIDPGGIGAS